MIHTKNLSKSFSGFLAVDTVNLDIAAGEIYGLVGPDGAGKTTTIRLLCRALEPDKGSQIEIAGCNLLRQTEEARAKIGYLPQRFSLYEDLTVMENIRFFAEVRGLPPVQWRDGCQEILKFVGLEDFTKRLAGQLSGGMKQKLGLAAALVHKPQVLILDEPTTGVDPVTRQDFWQLIIHLVGGNGGGETAVLISTPYMDEAARCSSVGFMRQGRIIKEGSPAELCLPLEGQILEINGSPLTKMRWVVQDVQDIQDVQMFGDRLHCRVSAGKVDELKTYLEGWLPAQGFHIIRIQSISPQLEDAFISLLEEGQ